jgi:hypothetical protein
VNPLHIETALARVLLGIAADAPLDRTIRAHQRAMEDARTLYPTVLLAIKHGQHDAWNEGYMAHLDYAEDVAKVGVDDAIGFGNPYPKPHPASIHKQQEES